MTITLDLRPEVQAELARQAAAEGRALEAVAIALLEQAVQALPTGPRTATPGGAPVKPPTGQSLVDAFAEIRGLLTDKEIDQMFARNRSTARPVDLS